MNCASAIAQPPTAPPANGNAMRAEIDQAREKVYPALVNITVVFRYYVQGRTQRAPAGGSGVIISPDGYVITNFHVAGHTTHIVCTLASGEAIEAEDVYDDPLTDLSVLKLKLQSRPDPKAPLAHAELGDSDRLTVGDFVLAMGNPLMLSSSLTLGVISNTHRVFTDFTGNKLEETELDEGETTGLFTRWLQHDALILPGNSGGPLVNLQGQVVGINELGGNGVGFAIPSNLVRSVFQQVVAHGSVRRGWLGFAALPVNKLGRTTGTLVASVLPSSPAEKAGLKPGDILTAINETPTNVRFFEEIPLLYRQVADLTAGETAKLHLLRNGSPLTLTATVVPMEPLLGAEDEMREAGLTVRTLTSRMTLIRHLPDRDGVLVTGVRPGYPADAAQPKLAEDDVIIAVDGQPTPTVAALRKALEGLTQGKNVVVVYRHEDERRMTVIKPEASPPNDGGDELPHAWVGVKTQALTPDIAEALKLSGTKGLLITEVLPETQAARSGLKVGDLIVALNGHALDAFRSQDDEMLTNRVQDLTVGEKATLTVLRDGKKTTCSVVLEPTPTSVAQAKTERQKEFEFTIRDLTVFDPTTYHWNRNQKGVFVTEVTQGGWAGMADLEADDLIESVNGTPVTDVASFKQAMQSALAHKPKVVTLFVRRDYTTQFVFIEPDWTHLEASH
jgi:serine protease Do